MKFSYAVLAVVVILMALMLGGCPAPLPVNGGATADQIATVQNAIAMDELVYIAASTVLKQEIAAGHIKGQAAIDLQAADKVVWDTLETAYAAAGQGKNVSLHDLTVAINNWKASIAMAQGTVPATLPTTTKP